MVRITYVRYRFPRYSPNLTDYALIIVDTDLQALAEHLGINVPTAAYVLIDEGDYKKVYVTYSSTPHLITTPFYPVISYDLTRDYDGNTIYAAGENNGI